MKKIIMIAAVAAIVLTGCKPTEKNYRAAYEAAINKRQSAEDSLAADGLISDDGPRSRMINGESYYFLTETIKIEDGEDSLKQNNVVVAQFKMPTNARSGANSLRENGYDAKVAKALGDKWFIVAGSFETLDEAAKFIKEFKSKNKQYSYIGLGVDEPVIIRH